MKMKRQFNEIYFDDFFLVLSASVCDPKIEIAPTHTYRGVSLGHHLYTTLHSLITFLLFPQLSLLSLIFLSPSLLLNILNPFPLV